MFVKDISDVFNAHYPRGSMMPISLNNIPSTTMDLFECYSERFSSYKDFKRGNFDKSFIINYHDKTSTYVVTQKTESNNIKCRDAENLIYLVDVDDYKNVLSRSEVRLSLTSFEPFFRDRPLAGGMYFDDDSPFSELYDCDMDKIMKKVLIKKWIDIGTKQLAVMNALSRTFFQLPLYSDDYMVKHERVLWDNLVDNKQAYFFFDEIKVNDMYSIISQ